MKIAVFGKTGQVATELQRRVPNGVTLQIIGRDQVDFADPQAVYDTALTLDADAVINAVAYTAVDKAEDEEDLANAINGASVGALMNACANRMPLVHISTDYVFPGDGDRPWQPGDATGPLGAYGRSKLLGEQAIAKLAASPSAILRTSWVFSAHGNNFVKTMLRLGAERPELKVVADQIGGPTPAADIADTCFTVARALKDGHTGGIHHFSGAPDVSWADFAGEIMVQANLPAKITNIPTSDYPTPAQRPLNSRLDCKSLERDFGVTRPDWRHGLADVLKDLSP